MRRMSSAAWVAVFLLAATLVFVMYSIIITPRMDSGVPEQGYRRPIQDLPPNAEPKKEEPLQNSNVPPAGR
jgi:hypothetical protein